MRIAGSADELLSSIFDLPIPERVRFAILYLSELDDDDVTQIRDRVTALRDAGVDPTDKEAFDRLYQSEQPGPDVEAASEPARLYQSEQPGPDAEAASESAQDFLDPNNAEREPD